MKDQTPWNVLSKLLLNRIKDWGLGADSPDAGGYLGSGGEALSRWAIYGKKSISMPLDHISQVFKTISKKTTNF